MFSDCPARDYCYNIRFHLRFARTTALVMNAGDPLNRSFQWLKNSSPITGGNTPIQTAYTSGNYAVVVTDNTTGCSATSGSIYLLQPIPTRFRDHFPGQYREVYEPYYSAIHHCFLQTSMNGQQALLTTTILVSDTLFYTLTVTDSTDAAEVTVTMH